MAFAIVSARAPRSGLLRVRTYRKGDDRFSAPNVRDVRKGNDRLRDSCVSDRPQAVLAGGLENLASAYLRVAGFQRRVRIPLWLDPGRSGQS
jgi:hypothetical protein